MDPWVKAPAAKPDSLIPGIHIWQERTSSFKLSSDIHTHALSHRYLHKEMDK